MFRYIHVSFFILFTPKNIEIKTIVQPYKSIVNSYFGHNYHKNKIYYHSRKSSEHCK